MSENYDTDPPENPISVNEFRDSIRMGHVSQFNSMRESVVRAVRRGGLSEVLSDADFLSTLSIRDAPLAVAAASIHNERASAIAARATLANGNIIIDYSW
jgi:hypothetical protein